MKSQNSILKTVFANHVSSGFVPCQVPHLLKVDPYGNALSRNHVPERHSIVEEQGVLKTMLDVSDVNLADEVDPPEEEDEPEDVDTDDLDGLNMDDFDMDSLDLGEEDI